jgi:coronin-1B/1C/6
MSSSADLTIKLYDIQKGAEMLEVVGHTDMINNMAWNWNGSMVATTCKDKKLRVIDVRANKVVQVFFYQSFKKRFCVVVTCFN